MGSTPEVLAWANRTRSLARLSTGRLAEMDRALDLIEQNLKANPSSLEDQRLKAVLLALRTSRRGDAIKLLEPLDQANQLGTNEQFILAQTYLSERLVEQVPEPDEEAPGRRGEESPASGSFRRIPDRSSRARPGGPLGRRAQAALPQSPSLLELEARLLDLQEAQGPSCSRCSSTAARQNPDRDRVSGRLARTLRLCQEAEAAYKAFIDRNPNEPERVLGLASFLARQDRTKEAVALLDEAWKTCRPEAVAVTALALYVAPSADENLKHRVETWVAEAIRKSPPRPVALRPSWPPSIAGKDDTTRPRPSSAKSSKATPRTSRRSTTSPGNWPCANRANRKEALELINRAIEKKGLISTFVDTRAVALIRIGEPDRPRWSSAMPRRPTPRNRAWPFIWPGLTRRAARPRRP